VKNTDTARHKGYDAGKKVAGIKRHLAVDTQGLPHAIEVTTADVNDRNGALLMLLLNEEALSQLKNVLVDGACTDWRALRPDGAANLWRDGRGGQAQRAASIRCAA
jgi:hypothetical protein